MPALLTSTSRCPSSCSTISAACRTESSDVTSSWMGRAPTVSAAARPRSISRLARFTRCPAPMRRRTVSRPMPLLAPVTRATGLSCMVISLPAHRSPVICGQYDGRDLPGFDGFSDRVPSVAGVVVGDRQDDGSGDRGGVATDLGAVAVQQCAAADGVVDVAAGDVPHVGVLGGHTQERGRASADTDRRGGGGGGGGGGGRAAGGGGGGVGGGRGGD